jgi:hypothetical protein
MTHLRVNDHFEFPIIIGVVVWIAEGLRNPAVFRLAFGGQCSTPAAANPTPPQA